MRTPAFSDKNQRQLRRMREALHSIDMETLSVGNLASLIQTLDFLVDSLDGADKDWIDAFRRKWGVLEDIYAVALDTGSDEAVSANKPSLSMAISELAKLTAPEEPENQEKLIR